MEIVGIVAEFDPFHRGHAYLLRQVRDAFPGCAIAVAMSGSFTQRGSPAALSKQDRAEMALSGGANLVLLLPVTFACASAERFARGGVALL
ncbi:MAG: nucleotidyltransferase family protein, partial [Clostridiales bacterium]|nr:nucleotidyltransferase family protein [Clostridiales bacterium]